jgi:hypothetical protein
MGRTGGRQWGDSTAAYGEILMAAVIVPPRERQDRQADAV